MSVSRFINIATVVRQVTLGMRPRVAAGVKRSALAPLVMGATLLLRQPGQYWRYRTDLANWRRQARQAFGSAACVGDSSLEHVLFVETIGDIYEAKLIAMLAAPLIARGWQVSVLSRRFRFWSRLYLQSAGITRMIFWEDFQLDPADREQAQRAGAALEIPSHFTLARLKRLSYQGIAVGSQLIGMASRILRQGRLDLTDAHTQATIRSCMDLAIENVFLARHVMASIAPTKMVLIEANYNYGAVVDTAISSGVDVIQFCQPSRDDALIFKRLTQITRRHHPNSLSPDSLAKLRSQPWLDEMEARLAQEFRDRYGGRWLLQERNQQGVQEQSLEELRAELRLQTDKKVAVVFSHVLWDANLFYGEDLFEDFGEWFIETVKAACQNTSIEWLVKLHPANVWKGKLENITSELAELRMIREQIGNLPPHVRLILPSSRLSTWSLFQLADFGVTVRGTTGIEMPCLGIRTLTAGTGRYSGLGFTDDSPDRDTYLRKLTQLHTLPGMTANEILAAKQHAFGIFALRPWLMKSFRLEHDKAMTSRGALNLINNLHFVRHDTDLSAWVAWLCQQDRLDYLDEDEFARVRERLI